MSNHQYLSDNIIIKNINKFINIH